MTTRTTTTPTRTHRTTYTALWLLAGLTYGGLIAVGRPLVGVAAFAAFGLGAIAYRYRLDTPVADERDHHLSRVASERTVTVVGLASAVFFPTVVALTALGHYDWTPWLSALGVYVAAFFVLHGVITLLTRRA